MQSNNVFSNSAENIAAILNLHFPRGTILDVNYGLGRFYRNVKHRKITGVDIRPGATVKCDNRQLPFEDDSFDIDVCDPPYKRGDGVRYEKSYGKAPKTETQVTWSYHETLTELLRVSRHGLIVKLQDGTDGHRFFDRRFHITTWLKDKIGLEPHDVSCNVRFSLASTLVPGRVPHFFQQGVSYFLIYRWSQKNPYKRARF